MARVWLGVHFISDVVVGLMLGMLLLLNQRMEKYEHQRGFNLETWPQTWLTVAIICLTIGIIFQVASLISTLALAVGYACGGTKTNQGRANLSATLWLLSGMVIILGIGMTVSARLTAFSQNALTELFTYGLLGYWAIGILGYWLRYGALRAYEVVARVRA